MVPSAPGPGSLADGLGSDAEARAWSRLMGPLATRTHDVVAAALSDQRSVPPVAATAALGVAFARAHPRGALGDPLGPDGRTLLSGISAHAITPLSSPAATGVGLVLGSLLHSPRGWALPVGGSGALTAALSDALREAEEEIGLSRRHVRPLGYLLPFLSRTGYLITPVVGLVSPPFALTINPREVTDAFEVPLAFLLDPVNHQRHSIHHRGALRQYFAMPYGDYFIWGATAGMIRSLTERLGLHGA